MKEEVVAVVSKVPNDAEQSLVEEVAEVKTEATAIKVLTETDYAKAADVAKEVKTKAAAVVEFFKPLKDAAHKAHAEICSREKDCLAPLKDAEAALKNAMRAYLEERERIRREAEEAARKAAKEEAEQRLAEAIDADNSGDKQKADELFAQAAVTDGLASSIVISSDRPEVSGVSASRDWEITSVDPAIVPAYVAGAEIRPIDLGAVKRLIRASKGTIQIPGVVYKETANISIRRK